MTPLEFREALRPIIEQYAAELFDRPGRRAAVDTLIKRQTTAITREVVFPIERQRSDSARRQRDMYQ